MEDPLDWLPAFLRDRWDLAVESLRAEGVNVTPTRANIVGAHEANGALDIERSVGVKLYEVAEQHISRTTQGDADRDVRWQFSLDIQRRSPTRGAARKSAHDAIQVLVRILELHRSEIHPDWNRVEDIRAETIENYWDYQKRVITFSLRRYGQPMVARVYNAQTTDPEA